MEKIKNAPLKKTFICAVSFTVAAVVFLSASTIFLCYRLQGRILPDSNEAVLSITEINGLGLEMRIQHRFEFGKELSMPVATAYEGEADAETLAKAAETVYAAFTIDRIDNSFSMLSPKKKTAYTALAAAKIALPFCYSVAGIVLCAAWFYRAKLSVPIRLLTAAAENISRRNLDFEISYTGGDEMGLLCRSFEEMRQALWESNRELWGMIEGRRTLMASVAHDLRNPISIMEGCLEYLQERLPRRDMEYEDILNMVNQTMAAAGRLERYTDSLRDVHLLEEQELRASACNLPELLEEMSESFLLLGQKRRIKVEVDNGVPPCGIRLDGQVLYRILENLFANALRFAKGRIRIAFTLRGDVLTAEMTDDGAGFSEKLLRANHHFFTTDTSGEHIGMGLAVCEILCRKHGGSLSLSNLPEGGADVRIHIKCEKV